LVARFRRILWKEFPDRPAATAPGKMRHNWEDN
jgi:hypothetical protein